MSGTFRDLEVWQKAFDLTLSLYSATRSFPREETYRLTIQLRRADVSIVSNIAEGRGRSSDKELLQFLANAKGSLFEVETQLELAKHLAYLSAPPAEALVFKVNETGRLLNGLMRAFRPSPKMQAPFKAS